MSESSPAGTLAERVAAQVRKLRPETEIEIRGPLELIVKAPHRLQAHLSNLDAGCKQEPSSCDERVLTFSRALLNLPSEQVTELSLLPVLKNQAWVTHAEQVLAGKGQPTKLVAFPLVDDLRIVLVQDTPVLTKPLSEHDLEEVGWTREAARERALANLKGLSSGFKFQETAPELYGLSLKNGYDAAMMILHEQWSVLRAKVAGDLVAAPIARDILLFTGTKNEQGIKTLLMILQVEKQQPSAAYPITTELYRWQESGWERFVP